MQGKFVDAHGKVDHSSPATTPHLKLFMTLYTEEVEGLSPEHLPTSDGLLRHIDGISLFPHGQNEHHANFTKSLRALRRLVPKHEIIAGVYVRSSGPDHCHSIEAKYCDPSYCNCSVLTTTHDDCNCNHNCAQTTGIPLLEAATSEIRL